MSEGKSGARVRAAAAQAVDDVVMATDGHEAFALCAILLHGLGQAM